MSVFGNMHLLRVPALLPSLSASLPLVPVSRSVKVPFASSVVMVISRGNDGSAMAASPDTKRMGIRVKIGQVEEEDVAEEDKGREGRRGKEVETVGCLKRTHTLDVPKLFERIGGVGDKLAEEDLENGMEKDGKGLNGGTGGRNGGGQGGGSKREMQTSPRTSLSV